MSKKVLITNIVSLNPGDAAILLGMKCLIEEKYGKDAELIVYDRNAAAARKYYNWCTFRQSIFVNKTPPKWFKFLNRRGYRHVAERLDYYRVTLALMLIKAGLSFAAPLLVSKSTRSKINDYLTADVIMCSGGTFLTENYNIQSCLYDFRFSTKTNAKLGFFPQTLGPFHSPKNKQQLVASLSKFDSLMLRDEASRKHLTEIGVPANLIHLVPDAAFSIGKFIALPPRSESNTGAKKVAVSVRPLKFFEDGKEDVFIQAIAGLVGDLVQNKGYQVTFLSTCQGIEEYWSSDDKMADRIHAQLPESIQEKVSIDREFREPLDFIKKCVEFDFIIATRMHAAIMAISCGIPAIAIAYEFKIAELYKNLGLEPYYANIDDTIQANLAAAVEKIDSAEFSSVFNKSREEITRSSLNALTHMPG